MFARYFIYGSTCSVVAQILPGPADAGRLRLRSTARRQAQSRSRWLLLRHHDLLDSGIRSPVPGLRSPHKVHPRAEAADVVGARPEVQHLPAVDGEEGNFRLQIEDCRLAKAEAEVEVEAEVERGAEPRRSSSTSRLTAVAPGRQGL